MPDPITPDLRHKLDELKQQIDTAANHLIHHDERDHVFPAKDELEPDGDETPPA